MSEHHGKRIDVRMRSPVADIAEQLQGIVNGLQSGSIGIQHSEERVVLEPNGRGEMRLRVRQKDNEERLKVELWWRRAPPDTLQIGNGTVPEPHEAGEKVDLVETSTEVKPPRRKRATAGRKRKTKRARRRQ